MIKQSENIFLKVSNTNLSKLPPQNFFQFTSCAYHIDTGFEILYVTKTFYV